MSRIEGFSDAVFAFAITLLVVSLEVPKSFDQLLTTVSGFAAFGVSFTALVGIWFVHYNFFRKYGLHDTLTIILNALLLFVVLFYIYPLKFLFSLLINAVFLSGMLGIGIDSGMSIRQEQVPTLMIIYGLGFLVIFLIFALLHLHAYRQREELQLSPVEILMTRGSIGGFAALAGWIYGSLGLTQALYGRILGGSRPGHLRRSPAIKSRRNRSRTVPPR